MTTQSVPCRLDDGLTILRRVRDYEVLEDQDGGPRPSSQAFIQGGPDGNVSVHLASETTPERIIRDYPGTYIAEVEISTIRGQGLDVEREPIEGTSRRTKRKTLIYKICAQKPGIKNIFCARPNCGATS